MEREGPHYAGPSSTPLGNDPSSLEPHVDPWSGTTEGRGPERDNPYESAASQTPFGPTPETVGVPNMVRSQPRTGAAQTNRPRLTRARGLLLLLLFLGPAVLKGIAWTYEALSAWIG